jgi:sialic acid synthase SpsE
LERIAHYKRPTIVSSGGATEKSLDEVVEFFENRNIPLAINHCVSLYPSEDHELELNQIDYLRTRYPGHVIGFSSHEYHDWQASMYLSYAKGARTWERHIDIDEGDVSVSNYCSLPHQVDTWFKAYKKAQEMSGGPGSQKRIIPKKEVEYLNALVRGVYANRDLPAGYEFSKESFQSDVRLAVPLQKGQLSTREVLNGTALVRSISKNEPLMIDDVDSPYATNEKLKNIIMNRGL